MVRCRRQSGDRCTRGRRPRRSSPRTQAPPFSASSSPRKAAHRLGASSTESRLLLRRRRAGPTRTPHMTGPTARAAVTSARPVVPGRFRQQPRGMAARSRLSVHGIVDAAWNTSRALNACVTCQALELQPSVGARQPGRGARRDERRFRSTSKTDALGAQPALHTDRLRSTFPSSPMFEAPSTQLLPPPRPALSPWKERKGTFSTPSWFFSAPSLRLPRRRPESGSASIRPGLLSSFNRRSSTRLRRAPRLRVFEQVDDDARDIIDQEAADPGTDPWSCC